MTKSLHWLTVVAITTQFVVGYVMDDGGGQGRGRGRGRGGESGRGRGRGGDDDLELGLGSGDDVLITVHVGLELTIVALALIRVVWRRATPLPPWAAGLSRRERSALAAHVGLIMKHQLIDRDRLLHRML